MASETITSDVTTAPIAGRSRYLRRLGAAFAIGLPGVLVLGVYTALGGAPGGVEVSPVTLFVSAVVANALVLLVSVAVGAYAAPRAGLRSHVLARVTGDPAPEGRFRAVLPLAIGAGILGGVIVFLTDELLAPYLPAVFTDSGGATVQSILAFVPFRVLYGGITEELLIRFAVMGLIAFLGFRLLNRDRETPSASVVWGAIVLSSLVFGLGHLPSTAAVAELTPIVVSRALLLNAVPGILFGWLYWRNSLEAAMAAHVAFHVLLVAVSLILVI